MAPLPYNSTSVLKVQYTHDSFGEREMLFRAPTGVSANDITTSVVAFLGVVASVFWFDEVSTTGATWQAAGTDFSLPTTFPVLTGANTGALAGTDVPRFFSVNGRGIGTGRETKVGFYFVDTPVDDNYRYAYGELATVDTLLDAWQALCEDETVCTIGGDVIVPRQYANVGYNAYWQRRLRLG